MNLEPGQAHFVPVADGSPVIMASGEIDVATVPDLTAALDGMIARGAKAISVDMEHVTFIDSSGLGALVAALKKAQDTDATLTLVNLTGSARKVFEITGLLETFGVDGAQT
jgi:anti-sigma B factor antagonist